MGEERAALRSACRVISTRQASGGIETDRCIDWIGSDLGNELGEVIIRDSFARPMKGDRRVRIRSDSLWISLAKRHRTNVVVV